MPVVVQNKKTSDISRIWPIVSRVTAAVLGGYVVTYWTGIAVARVALGWNLLGRADAGMDAVARNAVSRRRITHFVLRNARHEAIKSSAVVHGTALKQGRAGGATKFIPADSSLLIGAGSHLHGLADQE